MLLLLSTQGPLASALQPCIHALYMLVHTDQAVVATAGCNRPVVTVANVDTHLAIAATVGSAIARRHCGVEASTAKSMDTLSVAAVTAVIGGVVAQPVDGIAQLILLTIDGGQPIILLAPPQHVVAAAHEPPS